MAATRDEDATLCCDVVLAADQPAWIVARGYVTKANVMRQAAEERNAFSNQHRDTGDDETLNKSRAQELLNRNSTVDVEVMGAAGSELRNDLSRSPGHLFHDAANGRGELYRTTAEDDYALITIRPAPKRQNSFEGLATHHDSIDAGYELLVAVRLAAVRRQKVEGAVRSRNKAVEAGANKDGCHHGNPFSMLVSLSAKPSKLT
jgi:hypothetical protein